MAKKKKVKKKSKKKRLNVNFMNLSGVHELSPFRIHESWSLLLMNVGIIVPFEALQRTK